MPGIRLTDGCYATDGANRVGPITAIEGGFTTAGDAFPKWTGSGKPLVPDVVDLRRGWVIELQTEGVKYDETKPPLHLIAPDFLYALADILDFGAKKYAPRNWEKGMSWHKVYRAAIGHLFDWWRGAGPDPETGKSHLWHAACCIMFLVCYEMWGIGTDDRPENKKAGY